VNQRENMQKICRKDEKPYIGVVQDEENAQQWWLPSMTLKGLQKCIKEDKKHKMRAMSTNTLNPNVFT